MLRAQARLVGLIEDSASVISRKHLGTLLPFFF